MKKQTTLFAAMIVATLTTGALGSCSSAEPAPKQEKVYLDPNTGYVDQVLNYCLQHAVDQDSYHQISYGPVQKHGDGFKVWHKYTVDGGTFKQMFYLDAAGNVTETEDIK